MNLNTIGTTSGAAPYDERGLQIVIDNVPGTPNVNGEPILSTDITTDYQDAEDWITHRSEGSKEDDYSAVLRKWVTVTGNLAPDYQLLFWKCLSMFGLPVDTDVVTIKGVETTEYEFRLPIYGSVERVLFTGQWGKPDNAFRCAYGLIQSMTIRNAANGNTDGDIAMMFKEGVPNMRMIGYGKDEVRTITAEDLAAPADIVIAASPLGAGGTITIDPDMTSAELLALLVALPAFGSVKNVLVSGEIADGNGEFKVTYRGKLGGANIAQVWTPDAELDVVTVDGAAPVAIPVPKEPKPILPSHWYFKRGETLAGALASNKLREIETHEIAFGELVNPHYTENQELTFEDHVDGPVNVTGSIALAYNDDPGSLCAILEAEALGESKGDIAKASWNIFGAEHPSGIERVIYGIYGSATGTRGYGNENNIYRKTFPFSRKRNTNAAEGYSFFVKLRIPTV